MDGELERADSLKLLDAIHKDTAARQKWQRYNIYAAVLREDLPAPLSTDFHEKLACKLSEEPVRLTPGAVQSDQVWRKPVFGLAIAASLLAVVVVLQKPFTSPIAEPLEVAKVEAPQSDGALIVANSKQENVRERINRLLVEHNEYNPASDMTGMMPYSRFVSYSPDADIRN